MTETKPTHKHDCAECTFMGADQPRGYEITNGVKGPVDMYRHDGKTLIRRYSSRPDDYTSTPAILVQDSSSIFYEQYWMMMK